MLLQFKQLKNYYFTFERQYLKTYENVTDHFIYLIFSILNAIYYYPSSDLLYLYCYVQEKAVLHHRIIGTSGYLID